MSGPGVQRQGVRRLRRCQYLDRRVGVASAPCPWRTAPPPPPRRSWGRSRTCPAARPPAASVQHRLQVDLPLELGLGVQRAVQVVLHRHRAICSRVVPYSYMCRRAIMACSDGKVAPNVTLPLLVRRRGLDLVGLSMSPDVGHLLRPADHHHVVHARGDGQIALPERQSAGCAGRLHPGRRDVVPGQAGIVGDERGHVLLLDVAPGGHVAHVQGVDLLAGRPWRRRPRPVRP